jgi:uncharacterized caspase-like protein
MAPTRSTAEALTEALRPLRLALLIGVDEYRDPAFERLRFAGHDAEELGRALLAPGGGGFDRVVTLTGPEATTRARILWELQVISKNLREEDSVVVYFSGHGTLDGAASAARLYLVSSDASSSDLRGSALDVESLRDFFSSMPAMRKALVIDACFNGRGKSRVDPALQPRVDELLSSVSRMRLSSLASGEAQLSASSPGRPAFEDEALQHGVYTHFLLQALTWGRDEADIDADGLLTAWEAHEFARARTMDHTDRAQVPEAALRVVGVNDLVLAGSPASRAERDRALVYDYRTGPAGLEGATLMVDGRSKGVFPAAIALEPGTHHIELRDPKGALTLDGYVDLRRGAVVQAGDLAVMVREDRYLLSIRPAWGGGARETWGPVWGAGFLGLEIWTALRKARPAAKGLTASLALGAGMSPSRQGVDDLVRRGRGMIWGGVGLGWSGGAGRFRGKLAWEGRATYVPLTRLDGSPGVTLPEEAGWIVFSTGPAGQIGLALGRRWSLVLGGSAQGSPIRMEEGGPMRLRAFFVASGGLEFAL